MKNYILILLFFCTAFTAVAQEDASTNTTSIVDLASDRSDFLSFSAIIHGNQDIDLDIFGESELNFQKYNLEAAMRFFLGDSFFLDAGIYFRNYNLDIDDILSLDLDTQGYLLDFNFSFNFVFDNFLLTLIASPGIRSDFDSIDSQHYNIDFLAKGAYKINDFLALVAGAKLYQRGNRWEVIPVGGLNFLYDDFYANILAPFDAEIGFHLSKNLTIFAKYEGVIKEQFATEVLVDDDNFRVSYFSASAGLRVKIAPNVSIFASGGYNFETELEGDGNNASADAESDDGVFMAEVGLEVEIDTDFGLFVATD